VRCQTAALYFVYFNPKLLATSHKSGDARATHGQDNKKRKYTEQFAQRRADVYFLVSVRRVWEQPIRRTANGVTTTLKKARRHNARAAALPLNECAVDPDGGRARSKTPTLLLQACELFLSHHEHAAIGGWPERICPLITTGGAALSQKTNFGMLIYWPGGRLCTLFRSRLLMARQKQ